MIGDEMENLLSNGLIIVALIVVLLVYQTFIKN